MLLTNNHCYPQYIDPRERAFEQSKILSPKKILIDDANGLPTSPDLLGEKGFLRTQSDNDYKQLTINLL